MASVMVTIDKAEAIGVINIASPIVNPRFMRKEKSNKNKIIPNFTNSVVNNHPISSDITSLMFQKTPKKKAPKTVSLTPDES
jgi:hypothetical protein